MLRLLCAATIAAGLVWAETQPEAGARVFGAQCASCHGMDGAKALEAGPPLREREIPDSDMKLQVDGRLAEETSQADRDALLIYVRNITKRPKQPAR